MSKHIIARSACKHARKKMAVTVATLLITTISFAEDSEKNIQITLPEVSVTGNPLGLGADALVVPVKVLNGRELSLQRAGTIGETLSNIPGVSSTGFGPNVGRPIIRGLDAERVRIMQNGVGIIDASSLSFDHAVSIDPLVIEQIDVVRGPAALLYGGSAMGGVVNATDNRIPKEQLNGISGRAEARFGGAESQKNGAVVVELGNGDFAVHADVYKRKTDDMDIPGLAVSKRKSEADGTLRENQGRLINSRSEGDGGAFGASATFNNGYVGFSYGVLNNNYGTVAEPDVSIDMRSDRLDLASELRDVGAYTFNTINRVKFSLAHTDYVHKEIAGNGMIGTTFKNAGLEGALELGHAKIGNMQGVIGLQFQNTRLEALGEEAFVPKNNTVSRSVYIYEDLPLTGFIDALKFNFGGRLDDIDVDSSGGLKFGASQQKNFTPKSVALGGLYTLNNQWSLATNLSHNERAPSNFEIYADGPHLATGQFEIGNTNLRKERSNGIDAQIRWKSGQDSLKLGAYYTKFSNFIGLFNTANTRGVDGELNPVDTDGDGIVDGSGKEIVAEAQFVAVPAVFKGLELEGKFGITDHLAWTMRGDYVRATNKNTGKPLPRISPLRVGVGLQYQKSAFGARLDILRAFKQNRVDEFELVTDAYTSVNALATYKLPVKMNIELFAKANNLLNEEIREHTSILKDISPAGKRSILFGLRADF